jgi:hypothetical protein
MVSPIPTGVLPGMLGCRVQYLICLLSLKQYKHLIEREEEELRCKSPTLEGYIHHFSQTCATVCIVATR